MIYFISLKKAAKTAVKGQVVTKELRYVLSITCYITIETILFKTIFFTSFIEIDNAHTEFEDVIALIVIQRCLRLFTNIFECFKCLIKFQFLDSFDRIGK